jgi:hypothetical protein
LGQKIAKIELERTKLSKSIKETKEIQKRIAGKLRMELGDMKDATIHLKSAFKADLHTACGHLEQTRNAYKKLVRYFSLLIFGRKSNNHNSFQLEETTTPVREIEVEKQYVTEQSDAISQKLEELRDIIDQVKV